MSNQLLSERGMQRRQQILSLAKGAARRRRGKHTARRGLSVFCLFAAIGLTGWSLTRLQPIPTPQPIPIAQTLPSLPPAIAVSPIEYVATDPTITDRLTLKPEPPRWTTVTDTELLQELADAGQPVGIICMNGKTILLPRN